jgi:hypothetical protein
MASPRRYLILLDTLGDGLTTISGSIGDLDIIEEPDLEQSVKDTIEDIISREGASTVEEYYNITHGSEISDEIVLLELTGRVGGEDVQSFIGRMCVEYDKVIEDKQSDEYKEYLRLKAIFDPD